ncbi:methyltransferase domain-containing protein [Nocardia sp. SYP-A9097]|uniref:methyltransferase n=1 Tax=Nocardia sp. SYP-A9097 TaxID=2663237 RepID=UPI00129ACF77|nr:methyltransferase [Nocardia sp. SYP-A9097]MRH86374.1 methyltransferase domain-containing protein [Nocardia sp. SYP-A9097]
MGAHTHGHSHSHGTTTHQGEHAAPGNGHAHGHSHGHGHDHTHDSIDWATQIGHLRREDAMAADAQAQIAQRLIGLLTGTGAQPVVMDIGAGAGGQSAAFARELAARGGGRLIIADAVSELLDAARATTAAALGGDNRVSIETVLVDAAADSVLDAVSQADLVWASRMVHHLPDQQAGTDRLAKLVRTGGWLALAEGGLPLRCLPWDLGVGTAGLQDRLLAVRDEFFGRMRAEITGTVPMPYGWGTALTRAGLTEVSSFSVLTDQPTATPEVRESVTNWLDGLRNRMSDNITADDRKALDLLLDPAADTYIGARDDIFLLGATTIHLGRR